MLRRAVFLEFVFLLVVLPSLAFSADPLPAYVDGELLVKFVPGTDAGYISLVLGKINARAFKHFRLVENLLRIKLPAGMGVREAMAALKGNPLIEYLEPNYIRYASSVPDDPQFGSLWGLDNSGQTGGTEDADIDAPEAWDITTGSAGNIVAVIDTGVDMAHQDLAPNIWTNPGEIPGNGIDDDGNGFIDDVHGWDFYSNDADPSDTVQCKHGTHVAGTIGAAGNNGTGVAGVNWTVKIMPLRMLGGRLCSGTDADAIEAIQYAAEKGARVANLSWGGSAYDRALEDAIRNSNILFLAAAGNGNWKGIGINNDKNPQYPAGYPLDNIVSVAATDHKDLRASFSNYGLASVDLGAPGVDILSTVPGNSYAVFSGTSMATPHTTGSAALLLAANPLLENWQIIWKLLQGTDYTALPVLSGGRLNINNSLLLPDPVRSRSEEDALSYSRGWSGYWASGFSGGRAGISKKTNSYAAISFSGSGVMWIAAKGNLLGKADVYIDDVFMTTVDLYSPSNIFNQVVYSNLALPPGSHTLKIVVKGTKNTASKNYYVDIDAIDIVN